MCTLHSVLLGGVHSTCRCLLSVAKTCSTGHGQRRQAANTTAQVLFAEMQWVGSKEANPSEAPLEMPEELQAPILRKSATGASHAGYPCFVITRSSPSCCKHVKFCSPDDAAASGELRPARRQRSPASQPASQPATQPASQPATQPASQPASQRSRGAGAPRSSQKRRRDAATPDSSSEDDDDAVEGAQTQQHCSISKQQCKGRCFS